MEKLLFVYNADSGLWNGYLDMAHKVFSPKTYPCSLCDLTYGVFKIRPEWADFIENAPVPMDFLHKDEFHAAFPTWKGQPLPVVLKIENGQAEVLFSAEELGGFRSVAELKAAVLGRLGAY